MTKANTETGEITGLALLRVPFPPSAISLLPKPTIKNEEWKKLPKAKCNECGGWHATTKTIHLSYVGHAALTDRLLDADPAWTWEPVAMGEDGQPKLDADGGMWIRLTVCGVTRLGYGDAQGKAGGNAVKERIGDALRNAAMRFGAALDLWHKGDLHAEEDDGKEKDPGQQIIDAMTGSKITPNADAGKTLTHEERERVKGVVSRCLDHLNSGVPTAVADAVAVADEAEMTVDDVLYFWTFFDSKQKTAMKLEQKARRQRALQRETATQA